jgi:thioesterase domain-containing protein
VEFLGRLDHQVKIRGFRIELGEVEAVLEQHPAVQQAVAVAREGEQGDKYLAVYFITKQGDKPPIAELRDHLRKQLPDYMIPSAFVSLREFPLTANGKVDRKALPAPQATDYERQNEYIAPRDKIEKKLAKLWQEVLGVHPIGVKDGFFELGGRSILAARLFIKIAHSFGRELPLTTLIQAPTLELLANELRPAKKNLAYPTLVPMRESGYKPPFFCVHGGAGSTLFLHRLAEELSPDQPFYGIEPEGLDGRKFQRTTIEQMASHYLSEIRKVQPVGPYYIGGYCFGGIVAFEMAQQLREQGYPAALIALFTAPLRYHRRVPPPKSATPATKPASSKLATLRRAPARAIYRKIRGQITKLHARFVPTAYKIWFRLGQKIPPSMRTLYVWRTLLRAEQLYVPKPYSGKLVLFHGSDYTDDPNLGWDGLAEGFEHRTVGEGSQDSRRDLMYEPLVAQTARELLDCIQKSATASGFPSASVAPATTVARTA